MKVIPIYRGVCIYVFMSQKPETIIRNIRIALASKGYKKDIPLNVWNAEFMYQTGYGKTKIREWTENFELIKLITINNEILNFIEG